jgi:hypothetical protein
MPIINLRVIQLYIVWVTEITAAYYLWMNRIGILGRQYIAPTLGVKGSASKINLD